VHEEGYAEDARRDETADENQQHAAMQYFAFGSALGIGMAWPGSCRAALHVKGVFTVRVSVKKRRVPINCRAIYVRYCSSVAVVCNMARDVR
jgi:hypothetical protein